MNDSMQQDASLHPSTSTQPADGSTPGDRVAAPAPTKSRTLGTYAAEGEEEFGSPRLVGWLSLCEIRRVPGYVTRCHQGVVDVLVAGQTHIPSGEGPLPYGVIGDDTILVGLSAPECEDGDDYAYGVRVTSGEARSLAALLLKAADDVDLAEYVGGRQ
ncbi:hypothetical protein KC207_14195 [Phycicoccus sp. BSK3Z-2]|uniref:Uncharacterized protein n=1 Tax=Phycicoccus avicenniae TaxID=2828860 RepID=A0A941I0T0_9MICO|nr:hypothetical protein [Phycicoccus avicenniae]MBR7744442.1 hypothetical protein [Phycicoccus avicenniae]